MEIRTEWRDHALCTDPADRTTTEAAITDLYALVKRPPPRFAWVDSPTVAATLVPSKPPILRPDGPWPVEARIADRLSQLRNRFDQSRPADTNHSAVHSGVRLALDRTARQAVAATVKAAIRAQFGVFWFGQQEADWIAYYLACQHILGDRHAAADAAEFDLWAALTRSCGWWWPRADVCVIAERPALIRTEPAPGAQHDELRLHAPDGPAVAYPDGSAAYSWHGTRVPDWVVTAPPDELVVWIGRERNIEVRRCAIERLGWAEFIDRAGLTLVGQSADPGNPGHQLRLYDLPFTRWGRDSRLLLAVNGSVERDGTRRWYGLRVPGWFTEPVDAVAWTYGLRAPEYAQLQRRT